MVGRGARWGKRRRLGVRASGGGARAGEGGGAARAA